MEATENSNIHSRKSVPRRHLSLLGTCSRYFFSCKKRCETIFLESTKQCQSDRRRGPALHCLASRGHNRTRIFATRQVAEANNVTLNFANESSSVSSSMINYHTLNWSCVRIDRRIYQLSIEQQRCVYKDTNWVQFNAEMNSEANKSKTLNLEKGTRAR